MWTKFRTSKIRKGGDGEKSLNVNEEYASTLRTQSYADFFAKAQTLVSNTSSFPSFCLKKFSEFLLEPCQESIPAILESSPVFSKTPQLKTLMLNYFDLSAEASKICIHLLNNINQIQSDYRLFQRDDFHSEEVISEMNSFIIQTNPFSTPNKHDFQLINDRHFHVLNGLKSKRNRIARKIKVIACINKAGGVCIAAACGLISVAAIIAAAHTFSALLLSPAILGFPVKWLKKNVMKLRFMRSGILRGIGKQLDVAAKGTYILNRDFDTMSRLVVRVHDEVERNKEMIQLGLDTREENDRFYVEVVKEIKKSDVGFRKQVEELQEHVYLCLLTINRARALVLNEMNISTLRNFRCH
ncbi:UPF0496 protein At3g49070-like [Euphorbia lathyris]|uniref:UPF0496 protein At3g49070-like n=1 Tax=Euphorbia lathyris TaxID=212925 RepID=UPI0033140EBA